MLLLTLPMPYHCRGYRQQVIIISRSGVSDSLTTTPCIDNSINTVCWKHLVGSSMDIKSLSTLTILSSSVIYFSVSSYNRLLHFSLILWTFLSTHFTALFMANREYNNFHIIRCVLLKCAMEVLHKLLYLLPVIRTSTGNERKFFSLFLQTRGTFSTHNLGWNYFMC